MALIEEGEGVRSIRAAVARIAEVIAAWRRACIDDNREAHKRYRNSALDTEAFNAGWQRQRNGGSHRK